jgi:N-hydroxyarylamine O-acetyltransferase
VRASKLRPLDVDAYLRRIFYAGPLAPSTEALRGLQVAHLQTVAFENLSIHSGEPIILEDGLLFDKIVRRRRGGFCYELNGLFAALLRALGFEVAMLSAGVAKAEGGFGPEFDHMTLQVDLEQRYLADVGFGDSFREPLLLDERGEQVQGGEAFRIDDAGERLVLMRRTGGEQWKPQYRFGLGPHVCADFEDMCRYHQTSPLSSFTQKRLCSVATPDGRITLSGMTLITTSADGREERDLANERECSKALRELFGVDLDG